MFKCVNCNKEIGYKLKIKGFKDGDDWYYKPEILIKTKDCGISHNLIYCNECYDKIIYRSLK